MESKVVTQSDEAVALKPPEKKYTMQQFPDDGREPLKMGDVLRVVEVNDDVIDFHWGKCTHYELTLIHAASATFIPADGWCYCGCHNLQGARYQTCAHCATADKEPTPLPEVAARARLLAQRIRHRMMQGYIVWSEDELTALLEKELTPLPDATPLERLTDEALRSRFEYHDAEAKQLSSELCKVWRLRIRTGYATEEDTARAALLSPDAVAEQKLHREMERDAMIETISELEKERDQYHSALAFIVALDNQSASVIVEYARETLAGTNTVAEHSFVHVNKGSPGAYPLDKCDERGVERHLHDWRWLGWPLSNPSCEEQWCFQCGLLQVPKDGKWMDNGKKSSNQSQDPQHSPATVSKDSTLTLAQQTVETLANIEPQCGNFHITCKHWEELAIQVVESSIATTKRDMVAKVREISGKGSRDVRETALYIASELEKE